MRASGLDRIDSGESIVWPMVCGFAWFQFFLFRYICIERLVIFTLIEDIFKEFWTVEFRTNQGDFEIFLSVMFWIDSSLFHFVLDIQTPRAGLLYVNVVPIHTVRVYMLIFVFKDQQIVALLERITLHVGALLFTPKTYRTDRILGTADGVKQSTLFTVPYNCTLYVSEERKSCRRRTYKGAAVMVNEWLCENIRERWGIRRRWHSVYMYVQSAQYIGTRNGRLMFFDTLFGKVMRFE